MASFPFSWIILVGAFININKILLQFFSLGQTQSGEIFVQIVQLNLGKESKLL